MLAWLWSIPRSYYGGRGLNGLRPCKYCASSSSTSPCQHCALNYCEYCAIQNGTSTIPELAGKYCEECIKPRTCAMCEWFYSRKDLPIKYKGVRAGDVLVCPRCHILKARLLASRIESEVAEWSVMHTHPHTYPLSNTEVMSDIILIVTYEVLDDGLLSYETHKYPMPHSLDLVDVLTLKLSWYFDLIPTPDGGRGLWSVHSIVPQSVAKLRL